MEKKLFSSFIPLLMIGFLLAACAMRTPAPPPLIFTLPPLSTETSVATVEVTAPTSTPTPAINTTVLFRDDFNGTLGEGWTWMSEYPSGWSLTTVPQTLQIMAGSGSVNDGNITNVLLRPLPQGDFEVETLLAFQPRRDFQFAGLLIYESNSHFIQVGRGFCSTATICNGDGLYFDYFKADKFERENFDHQYKGGASVYLQLRREGQIYIFMASPNGFVWQEIGRREIDINPVSVGLMAGQNSRQSIPAHFDFFEIRAVP